MEGSSSAGLSSAAGPGAAAVIPVRHSGSTASRPLLTPAYVREAAADDGDDAAAKSEARRRAGGPVGWRWLLLIGVLSLIALQTLIMQFAMESRSRDSARQSLSSSRHLQSVGGGGGAAQDEEAALAEAFDQYRVIRAKYPNKFANFSDYLLASKGREHHLRQRLDNVLAKRQKLRDVVVPPAPPAPTYTKEEWLELNWTYLAPEKRWPYVGNERYLDMFEKQSRKYYNSLAVFPHAGRQRMHGMAGLYPNGTRAWVPGPMPPSDIKDYPGGEKKALENGGFYLDLSNALPVDRSVVDTRDKFCLSERYDLNELEDVSVIITFYNEPASTLLRSLHSVLNHTPPPLLREILLVDDHSNTTDVQPGGYVYEYIKLMPKVKLMRMPERRGLVRARLAGAKLATAPVIVVLDSHIEVNPYWLEPQLKRLNESPRSVVFPQILSINTATLQPQTESGIGVYLSFKWMMQERPYFDAPKTPDPVPSPSMAGGLFAVRRDWFWESGAYDDEFEMWGAENVEMGFRIWMCGGRVEGIPCSRTYHIYRNGGSGYKSPGHLIRKNRIRTALIWTDEYWQIARYFLKYPEVNIGPLEKMLKLKDQLKCKSFKWYLENVDPKHKLRNLYDLGLVGTIKSLSDNHTCIDSMSNKLAGKPYGPYPCHGDLGAQGFYEDRSTHQLHNMQNEHLCLGSNSNLTYCDRPSEDGRWKTVPDRHWIAFRNPDIPETSDAYSTDYRCLGYVKDNNSLLMKPCVEGDATIQWDFAMAKIDPNYQGLTWENYKNDPFSGI